MKNIAAALLILLAVECFISLKANAADLSRDAVKAIKDFNLCTVSSAGMSTDAAKRLHDLQAKAGCN